MYCQYDMNYQYGTKHTTCNCECICGWNKHVLLTFYPGEHAVTDYLLDYMSVSLCMRQRKL